MSGPAKILVIRGGAIGDFILTLPVLAALRAQFSTVGLEVLGYAHIARLALTAGLADAVRSIEAGTLAPFFAQRGELPEAMREYLAGFAIVISYLYDPDGIFQVNVARCSPAQFIQGPHRPDDSAGRHATEVFLEPLQRLAIFDADPVPRLAVPRPSIPRGLALHPGSGSERKNWPESSWADLIRRLGPMPLAQGAAAEPGGTRPGNAGGPEPLILVGGEAEGGRLERLAHHARGPVEIARNLPLPELASRLAACRFFVGHDSGISHLAAAVGLPGLVLWGETSEAVWHPRSTEFHRLRAGSELVRLPADRVLEELTRLASLTATHEPERQNS